MRASLFTLACLLLHIPFAASPQQEAQAMSSKLLLRAAIGPISRSKTIVAGHRGWPNAWIIAMRSREPSVG